ncbi:MAG: hypothetical protein H8E34_14020 [Bacteroidetes bacterium]|nr:hypothetical protein [Bacteroidota bacterium]
MYNKFLKRLSPILVVLLISNPISAQNQSGSSQEHNEQVTIISSFDPTINQAFKVNTSPEDMKFSIDKPEFSFESLDINQPTEITLNPIKPVVINADKRTSLTKNSLKLGVGSLFSPYLDFFHSSGQKNNYRFNAHLYQLSTFKNINDYSPSPETNSYLNLNYKKFFRYHIFDAGLKYSFKTNRYYGFKPDDYPSITFDENRLKQMYNLAKVNMALSSNYSNNKKLFHQISLDAYYYFDKYNTSETNANVNFDVHKSFNVSDMLDYQELGLAGKVSYFENVDSLNTSNELLVSATPYFKGNYGMFNFYLGLNFNILNSNETNFYFYPIIDLNVNLIPDILTVFGGVNGKVEKHSFLKLSELNPWVGSTIPLGWDHIFKAYAGIRGNIAQKVNFSTQVTWEKFNNMFFFVNVPDDTIIIYLITVPFNKFSALYDKGSVLAVSGEITYAAGEKVNILIGGKYNIYTLDSLADAYHKPTSEIKLGVSFLITKKLLIWSEAYYYGKRTALDLTNLPYTQIDLDEFIDVNAGVDYTLTDKFSVFLSLNNLLNTQYQRYYNYPVHGIQIMGGIMYKF